MEEVLKKQQEFTMDQGIQVINLSKTYYKYPFGIKSKDDNVALSDIYLDIQKNELVSLLGHNGAGKSTLIGILTGLLSPSSGTAMIGGYDIKNNMSKIRKMMGVCPQFDILWNELTVIEHLEMYSHIKGVPLQNIHKEIDKILTEILLQDKKNCRIDTLSGGQKRRVSLGISAIGSPKIIFLDEPTTGMDPNTRREVWSMIQGMRKKRSIVLTTHAMEEADILSDRIMILSDGRLKAIGTPLYLKNNHGDSYRLSLILQNQDPVITEETKLQLKKLLPSSSSISSEASNIIVAISSLYLKELQQFFEILESEDIDSLPDDIKQLKLKIKEWNLSHATMEEVFMKLSDTCEQFRNNLELQQ